MSDEEFKKILNACNSGVIGYSERDYILYHDMTLEEYLIMKKLDKKPEET